MIQNNQKQLGTTLWSIANDLRGSMNADDFRDYMLAFLFLRYLSDNYEAAAKKELGRDYPDPNTVDNGGRMPLSVWYEANQDDIEAFEKQMRRKAHYVIEPKYLWINIAYLARTHSEELLDQFAAGSGKKAGEFYTPQKISSILSGIVTLDSQSPETGPRPKLDSIYDFACGGSPVETWVRMGIITKLTAIHTMTLSNGQNPLSSLEKLCQSGRRRLRTRKSRRL
jgi:type I restriction-modification system DNA methylase subunit